MTKLTKWFLASAYIPFLYLFFAMLQNMCQWNIPYFAFTQINVGGIFCTSCLKGYMDLVLNKTDPYSCL